jgi:predicted O-linked N-acetylglucosamine transferase (SPINDLY family)
MAMAYRQGGRPDEAERICRDCLMRHPGHPILLERLGELLLQRGACDEALPLLDQARQLAPAAADAWLLQTRCLLEMGRATDAKRLIAEAIRKGLRHPLADELLQKANAAKGLPPGNKRALAPDLRQLDSLLRAGKHAVVESRARELLRHHAGSHQLWYLLGMAVVSQGRMKDAVEPFRRAWQLDPRLAPAGYNLAFALERLGRLDEALDAYRRTVAVAPQMADAYNNMGNVLQRLKRHDEALTAYERAIALAPQTAPFRMNRGDALRDLGRLDDAVAAYSDAVSIKPSLIEAHLSLAHALAMLQRHEESVEVCRTVIDVSPQTIDAYRSLATGLLHLRRHDEAEQTYRRMIELWPDDVRAFVGLAKVQKEAGRSEEALRSVGQALNLDPGFAPAINVCSAILLQIGRRDEAFDVYRRALALNPDGLFDVYSDFLLAMNYQASADQDALLAEARAFGARVAREARPQELHDNVADPDRRLRIGLVSGDLGLHPVGFFLVNVLETVDQDRLELFAYATAHRSDGLNDRLHRAISNWRDARLDLLDDEGLVRRIREDRIDILVDLAGHTAKNRLPVFAWKPAPVQVGWLGYLGTTGLDAMDYILADDWAIPHGEEHQFTETPWRLPGSYICFSPPDLAIEPGRLPALSNQHVTFGCFNNLNKITGEVVACWARVLQAVPQSVLFLKTKSLGDEKVRERITESFLRHGVGSGRLILDGQFASHEEHFRAYQAVDIALDPFPYPGITTSVEALWMGVPVLSLKGDRFISHQGETILNNVGLPQWIADDQDDYVAKAASFATDLPALASLRAGLREQLLASPLCDAPRFARNLEEAFRGMWRIWCEKQKAG